MGGKSVEPAVSADRAKRDQAKGKNCPKAITMTNNMAELYDGLFMLTIKDNANNYSQADMLFLTKYCLKFCKAELTRHEFEFGTQQRFHVHAIARARNKKLPCYDGLLRYLKKYVIFNETTEETTDGHLIERKQLLIDSLTFRLSPITDENHFINACNYLVKEQCSFTDDLGPNPMMEEIMVQWNNY